MIAFMMTVALAFAGAARAADPKHEAAEDKARTVAGAPSKGLAACHADIEKHCAGVKAGESRIGSCLAAHKKELSKACLKWAGHGGKGHEEASLKEIDKTPKTKP